LQERKVGDFVRARIQDGTATAVHDLSDGGLAVALAEMAISSGIGATIGDLNGNATISTFFGEDQSRYLMTVADDQTILQKLQTKAEASGLFARQIGTTGGNELKLGESRAISVEDMRAAHEGWFPTFMQAAKS
jgi:phosphoribosylformylglycinamidine synthase subunit PurL